MSGQDLFIERERVKNEMNRSLKRAYESGLEFAQKTAEYRVALAQKILQLKSDGVQISILEKTAKGDKDVAAIEFEMNSAEVLYKAAQENVNVQKRYFDSIEADIKREIYQGTRE